MESDGSKVKVLYISGFERSGSTLLTKALGELDNTFAAGELRAIWWTSYLRNQACGCGEAFRDCPIWSSVTEEAFGGFDQVDYDWMINCRPRRRHTALMLMPNAQPVVAQLFARYIVILQHLYAAIANVTGSHIIIDESKTPLYGRLLTLVPSIDLYVIHLVRDPRGVQWSNLQLKKRGGKSVQHHNLYVNTLLWNVLNLSQEIMGHSARDRYLQVRYEDLMRDPLAMIERIKAFIGEPDIGSLTIQGDRLALKTNHIMSGNHNRMETGSVPLRPADAWKYQIDKRTRSVVTSLTFPLLHYYGYS